MINHILDFISLIMLNNALEDQYDSSQHKNDNKPVEVLERNPLQLTNNADVVTKTNISLNTIHEGVPKQEQTDHGMPMLILPTNSIRELQNFLMQPDNKVMMSKFVLNQLTKAIKNNWQYLELFRVGNTKYVARLDKSEYEYALTDLKTYFIKYEMYEDAEKCHRLIVKNKVNSIT